MSDFRTGDFIRLKNINLYKIDRVYGGAVNIFEISNINSKNVEIHSCKQRIPFSEIEPIPVNGVDDFQIYYDPITTAHFVGNDEAIPEKQTDKSYYLETFKNCHYKGETYYQLINKRNLKYVHEIQNFLRTEFQISRLRIAAL